MNHTDVSHISTKTVRIRSTSPSSRPQQIELSPWDLQFLRVSVIQKGLIYHYQASDEPPPTSTIIHRLETSLSLTLHHFFPLAGRLAITTHDDNTVSVCIDCNNAGAELIHAIAPNVTVADVKSLDFVHDCLYPLKGNYFNYDHGIPLLAVQATELVDGIFIGITTNHVLVDGTSFWHFLNTWSEICRTGSDHHFISAHPPVFQRWFPDDLRPPIRFRFDLNEKVLNPPILAERVFRFTPESIARLKAKANAGQPKTVLIKRISSLQAVLAHIWIAVTRARRLCSNEKTGYVLLISDRERLVPPLPQQYFGNAVSIRSIVAKAGELLEQGIGWAAAQLNKEINAHDDKTIRSALASWTKPWWQSDVPSKWFLLAGGSPRFNVLGNDFGWGSPIAVRNGTRFDGRMNVYEGCVEGSMDFEACLATQTLNALIDDADFMREVTVFTC